MRVLHQHTRCIEEKVLNSKMKQSTDDHLDIVKRHLAFVNHHLLWQVDHLRDRHRHRHRQWSPSTSSPSSSSSRLSWLYLLPWSWWYSHCHSHHAHQLPIIIIISMIMIITITMSMITTMIMMLQEHLCSLVVNARRHKAEVRSRKMHLRKQIQIHSSSYSFNICCQGCIWSQLHLSFWPTLNARHSLSAKTNQPALSLAGLTSVQPFLHPPEICCRLNVNVLQSVTTIGVQWYLLVFYFIGRVLIILVRSLTNNWDHWLLVRCSTFGTGLGTDKLVIDLFWTSSCRGFCFY